MLAYKFDLMISTYFCVTFCQLLFICELHLKLNTEYVVISQQYTMIFFKFKTTRLNKILLGISKKLFKGLLTQQNTKIRLRAIFCYHGNNKNFTLASTEKTLFFQFRGPCLKVPSFKGICMNHACYISSELVLESNIFLFCLLNMNMIHAYILEVARRLDQIRYLIKFSKYRIAKRFQKNFLCPYQFSVFLVNFIVIYSVSQFWL